MFKTFIKYIIICFILLLLLFTCDYLRIQHHNPPIFARFFTNFLDGGTKLYVGIGYYIYDFTEENYEITSGYQICPMFTSYNKAQEMISK